METECNINKVRLDSIVSPVEFKSEWTNEKKTCYVVGGFHGIESQNEWHKPVMSLAIVDDLSIITKLKEWLRNKLILFSDFFHKYTWNLLMKIIMAMNETFDMEGSQHDTFAC